MRNVNIIHIFVRKQIHNMSKWEVRKIANELLDNLQEELKNNAYDRINDVLLKIEKSEINWNTDVVNSVKNRYNELMNSVSKLQKN